MSSERAAEAPVAEAAVGPVAPAAVAPVGAVDCGTNSTRLLVARAQPQQRTLATLERRMTITRLGEGVDRRAELSAAAISRTVDVLEKYREACDRHGVVRLRATATSAARDAANRDEFFDAAEEALGVRPELLSGEEEGRLSFVGATADLDPAESPFVVVDLGGGSTEVAVGRLAADGSPEVGGVRSVAAGCVRMTEQFLHSDPPTRGQLDAAVGAARERLAAAFAELPDVGRDRRVVGLAGTVSTVISVVLGLTSYDRARVHHARLTREQVADTFALLARNSAAERARIPGVEPGRADVIVGGTAVLVALLDVLDAEWLLTSEADILDGLAASLTA